jgi:hypothetical protein
MHYVYTVEFRRFLAGVSPSTQCLCSESCHTDIPPLCLGFHILVVYILLIEIISEAVLCCIILSDMLLWVCYQLARVQVEIKM